MSGQVDLDTRWAHNLSGQVDLDIEYINPSSEKVFDQLTSSKLPRHFNALIDVGERIS